MKKIIALVLSLGLLFQQVSFAGSAVQLNLAGYLKGSNNPLPLDQFRPLHLRYFSLGPQLNNFNLFLDKGDNKDLSEDALKKETNTLLNYFLIGLSLPDKAFWVNLRPDSDDQIIDPALEETDLGRVLLEADLQLKKDTALFTSPQNPKGKEYWDRLYKKSGEIFGSENISIPTLTRPWIVPDEVIVRYTDTSAYIYKATLKVMLEQDYLKDSLTYNFKDPRMKELNEYSSQLIRELIIPEVTREVNTAKRYAPLRQVFYSLALAQCYKLKFSGKDNPYSKRMNSGDLVGLASKEGWSKTAYFEAYKQSFNKGEYNSKEPVYTISGQVIRSYFSGGARPMPEAGVIVSTGDPALGSPLAAPDTTFQAAITQAGMIGMKIEDGRPQPLPDRKDGSAGMEGKPNEDYNAPVNAAIRPQRKFSFARKITIPYAENNSVYRIAEGRRNVKQHMREVLDRVEENALTVVFGKEFERGKQVVKRGSADANLGWTDAMRELDPEGATVLMQQEEFTQKGFAALMQGDYQAFANYTNLYVGSRSQASRRWLGQMLQARKGAKGLARWVYKVYKMIMDNPAEYGNFIHLFEDIDAGISPPDYDVYAPGEIGVAMQAALDFNQEHAADNKRVGIFAVGAGGAGTVCILVGTSRETCLEFLRFLEARHSMVVPRLVTPGGAEAAAGENVITTTEVEQLTTAAAGTKYATGKHRLAFWVSAKADVDGVKINLGQWNEAPALKAKGLTLETPTDLPWVLVNRNTLKILPIEQVVDEQGNVRPEFSDAEWIVVKNWDLGFDHTKYFRLDRPLLAEENMRLIRERIAQNGFQGVFSELRKWAKDNNKKVFISVPSRWIDIIGSSWDLKDFRLYGTPEGDLRLELLPSCNAIPSEYRLEIEVSAIDDTNIIEYAAPQYFQGTHRVNPNKTEDVEKGRQPKDPEALLFVKHANPALAAQGIKILQRKERDVPGLFARLFGISGGLRLTVQKMDIVPRQGGMESGNAQADLVVAVFSMLTGAKFSTAEVSFISHVAQMNETNTLTGNQGADAAWAGAGLHVYMGGIYDMQAPRPFAAVTVDAAEGNAKQVALPYAMWHPVWGVNHRDVPGNNVPDIIPVTQQSIQLTAEQLGVINNAMRLLSPAARELVAQNTLIFLNLGEGLTGHRSLGRRQIEIEASLLQPGQEREVALRLWHETMEQASILFALQELGLMSAFNPTFLNPQARETTLVEVGGQKVALADVIDGLSLMIHNLLVNLHSENTHNWPASPESTMAGLENLRYVTSNLAHSLAKGGNVAEFLNRNQITVEHLQRAAIRINLVLAALRGINVSAVDVPVALRDIHPSFASAERDAKVFLQGGLPVKDIDTPPGNPVSPAAAAGVGGIDLRYIGVMTQFEKSQARALFQMPGLEELKKLDLSAERQELSRLLAANIRPSAKRLTDYVSGCYLIHGAEAGALEAIVCLVDFFRLEETTVEQTDPQLKAFLAFIESSDLRG